MKTNYSALAIEVKEAAKIAFDLFGIEGLAFSLNGEVDFNFRLQSSTGKNYILKISRPSENLDYLDFQQKLLSYVGNKPLELRVPEVVLDKKGQPISQYIDKAGLSRFVRLLTWVPGRLWAKVNPQTDLLRTALGQKAGLLTKALEGFEHPQAHRKLDWDNAQVTWVYDYLHLFSGVQKEWMIHFHNLIKKRLPQLLQLRKSVIHNDLNDYNIVVTENLRAPEVVGLIDYGDAIYTPIVNDLGVAGMYLAMHQPNALEAILPFVEGYNQQFPLEERELELLYAAVAMRLVISLTKAAINKAREPENVYHQISAQAGWKVLEQWYNTNEQLATYYFRHVSGWEAHPQASSFKEWAQQQNYQLKELFPTIKKQDVKQVDLGLESTLIGQKTDFDNIDLMTYRLSELQKEHPNCILAGGYLEPRFIYTTSNYQIEKNNGSEHRTIHLGTDFWLPAHTAVHAFETGEVVTVFNNGQNKDYGPTVILKHQYKEGHYFYTLYGHLSASSLTQLHIGQLLKKGTRIGWVGDASENGGWLPHLHFQVVLDLLGNKFNYPGVAEPSAIGVWKSLCPNPNYLFQLKGLEPIVLASNEALIKYRKKHLGKGLSLQYKDPIKMVRGDGVYLLDQYGQKYLDTVNNVAHVGHEHAKVVGAGQNQMAILNTNSRYLHDKINEFAKELLSTLPEEISVLHFVNSGSEANELALRMLKTATGEQDIIASEVGYHGNTNACIEVSSYKFDGKGGQGLPEHTHIIPLPDTFRGRYRGKDAGALYAQHVQLEVEKIRALGRGLAGFIIEPIISCGGQIELPDEFLKQAYKQIRAAGGYCVSDEVQVGCGRMGKTFWGFQLHQVVPDIVTIGKPLGNGHPLAAVACTEEIATKFANGMEYFNTFGGNPVSCAIGLEVLRTVKREKLQENALEVGSYLKAKLQALAQSYKIIGDVRGTGLFLGMELVNEKLEPLAEQATYLVDRMKDQGILMSIDGPAHNVLKIKPPLVFNKKHADELIGRLAKILGEDFMQLNG